MVSNNIGGNAVLRDLAKVIAKNNIPVQNTILRLTNDFELIIENI